CHIGHRRDPDRLRLQQPFQPCPDGPFGQPEIPRDLAVAECRILGQPIDDALVELVQFDLLHENGTHWESYFRMRMARPGVSRATPRTLATTLVSVSDSASRLRAATWISISWVPIAMITVSTSGICAMSRATSAAARPRTWTPTAATN